MLHNHRTSLATLHICRHNYAVEKGLVLDFCGQPHCGYLPYYPTARFRSPSSYMVSGEPFSDRSCRANLHKWGLAQSPSCDCGQRQTMNHIVDKCPLTKFDGGLNLLHELMTQSYGWNLQRLSTSEIGYTSSVRAADWLSVKISK